MAVAQARAMHRKAEPCAPGEERDPFTKDAGGPLFTARGFALTAYAPMVFLNPWAFWLGGIAPAIVLLYLLKVKRRHVAVSTLLFWQKVLQENRRRALFQRLRQVVSPVLPFVIFALVVLGLARPLLGRVGGRRAG